MKLSNALRAVQAAQPYFVILVVPGAQGPRVYARHFWRPEIERALRRIRLAEREGDLKFNRRHFDIRMGEADARDDVLGWMRTTIDGVKPSYAAEKLRIAATVGHEDGFGSIDFTFEGGTDDLLDLQLGLMESLPVKNVRYVPERFGIPAPRAQLDVDGATLFVEPEGKPARLRLQGGHPTEELLADATLFTASLPGEGSGQFHWRVDAAPLSLVGRNGAYSARLSMRYDDRRPLSQLVLFLTMSAWRGVGPVGCRLFMDGQLIPLGTLNLDPGDHQENWSELRRHADALNMVAKASLRGDPEMSIIDLCEAEPFLGRFSGFITSASIKIEYDPVEEDDPTRAAVYYVGCDVGEWCFLAVVERNTTADEIMGRRRSITFGSPRLLDAIVGPGAWQDHRQEIESAYQAQVERMGDPRLLWDIGELEAFISRLTRE
ncbi:MAG: hypothetical protein ACK4SZ_03090 [Allosphingosinicella sp.]|uniref:hypothetical protein n=1 Tax=Allosphingosinicella sp. TaxID=2823234 RepID=UPI00393B6547